MDERRSEVRLRRLKRGRIEYNAQRSVMTCTLRDVSVHGARLRFGESLYTPDEFVVSVPGEVDGRPAKRVWTANNEIGVRFTR